MFEIWGDVVGWEGFYQVSNLGKLRSLDRIIQTVNGVRKLRGKLLQTNTLAGRGYIYVSLSRTTKEYLHRLVAKTFVDNPENKPEVNHKDSNKLNNNASNLEWVTPSEHALYGYHIEGKSTPRKIDLDSVDQIRELLDQKVKQSEVAAQFGITQSNVSLINLGKIWNEDILRKKWYPSNSSV